MCMILVRDITLIEIERDKMTDRYVDIRAALEAGPTPGPWRFINHNNDPENSEPSDDWTIVSEATDKTVCSEPQCSFANRPALRRIAQHCDSGTRRTEGDGE